ncbi:MAG: hypothetical protein IKJ36_01065 [Clostridia bacterium]|nr:hypothetical protein [Clostridia bacterium]
MDNYEKRIKEILDRPITVSAQFEYAIDTAFLNKAKKSNNVFNNFSLKFATTVVCLLLTFSTAVFAAYMIYENIWKDPERTSRKQREESVLAPIDEEELNNIISEEKAKTIATTIIGNLGYENTTISEIKINRSYENNEDLYYHIVFDNITIQLDAKTGVIDYIENRETKNMIKENDLIDKAEAVEIANSIYKKVGIGNIDNYIVLSSEERDGLDDTYKNKYWKVIYGLAEDDIKLDDKIFMITFKIIDGNAYIYKLSYRRLNDLVNNPIVITEDEAIKIAIEKEKEFSNLEISKVSAELDMEMMNEFIYILENEKENDSGNVHVEDVIRNVWVVYIEHKKDNKPRNTNLLTVRQEFNKKYYIDATTGEIIGGKEMEYFNRKK